MLTARVYSICPGLAARKIAWAWLTRDAKTITRYHGEDGQWLDDTRTNVRGWESGSQALAQVLEEIYWPAYESGPVGLSIDLVASQVQVRPLDGYTLVSYRLLLAIGRRQDKFSGNAISR